ncbi:MAG: hypothetical protein PX483_21730 [Nostocales cyanobacterium LE14-WE4]|nr:hypothetical protein [Nostocales cyanobacterium LE14-WE4]
MLKKVEVRDKIFSDSLEIRNPSYCLKSTDEFEQSGSKTRN